MNAVKLQKCINMAYQKARIMWDIHRFFLDEKQAMKYSKLVGEFYDKLNVFGKMKKNRWSRLTGLLGITFGQKVNKKMEGFKNADSVKDSSTTNTELDLNEIVLDVSTDDISTEMEKSNRKVMYYCSYIIKVVVYVNRPLHPHLQHRRLSEMFLIIVYEVPMS